MFKKFWLYAGFGELKSHVLEDNISSWEKVHSVTKAEVFQKEQLCSFYKLTLQTPLADNLLLSAYHVIGKKEYCLHIRHSFLF